MKPEEIEKQWKETIENIVRDQFRKLIQIDFTCPYCGKKYTIKELGEWEEIEEAGAKTEPETKKWEASCENCEHAYRGADTVCSEWKRKGD